MYQMGEKCIEDKRNNYKALSVFLARAMNNSGFIISLDQCGHGKAGAYVSADDPGVGFYRLPQKSCRSLHRGLYVICFFRK